MCGSRTDVDVISSIVNVGHNTSDRSSYEGNTTQLQKRDDAFMLCQLIFQVFIFAHLQGS